MRIGLHALGIGPGADPAVVEAVARAADAAGFFTLWSGEHVVMVDRPDSPYPYTANGKIAVASDADWLDPLVTLAWPRTATAGTASTWPRTRSLDGWPPLPHAVAWWGGIQPPWRWPSRCGTARPRTWSHWLMRA